MKTKKKKLSLPLLRDLTSPLHAVSLSNCKKKKENHRRQRSIIRNNNIYIRGCSLILPYALSLSLSLMHSLASFSHSHARSRVKKINEKGIQTSLRFTANHHSIRQLCFTRLKITYITMKRQRILSSLIPIFNRGAQSRYPYLSFHRQNLRVFSVNERSRMRLQALAGFGLDPRVSGWSRICV